MTALSYTAIKKDEGRELKNVLRSDMLLSATLIRKLKNTGGIYVNSRPVFTNYRLSEGDEVTLDLSSAEGESGVVPEAGEICILYEDEWLIAVNKPSGQLSHPSRARYTGTLANFVSGYLGGVCHAVNRLDRDTSGIVLFAKSSYAKALAAGALSSGSAEKTYFALVCGGFEEAEGVIDAPIMRLEERDMRRGVREGGDRAVTHYRVKRSFERFGEKLTLLEIRLETGRTHQIRVHFEHIAHPLIGDVLYYTEKSRILSEKMGINAQALHAEGLSFIHPFTGDNVELKCKCGREELKEFFG